ncbi:MAG: sigma-70 family RNA polymerase sigma factor [bacterium]|jgi:RNA polymerase sigma-70 factor, ECF subfamily|nr:sigma-70 family RNA polymerase sigma factor [bacterium]
MATEQDIIERAQNSDAEAFGQLYDTYYQPIFGFMYNRSGNAELAKDLTSETFFQALKNIHKYKPRKGARFKSWLFAIAVAQVGNYYRSRKKFLEITTEEAPEIASRDDFRPDIAYKMGEDEGELKEKIELLREVMKQLNEKQQTILTLRYFSKMTVPEISATIGMKEGTIKSHIHRALKKMQALMVEKEEKQEEVINEPIRHYVARTAQS